MLLIFMFLVKLISIQIIYNNTGKYTQENVFSMYIVVSAALYLVTSLVKMVIGPRL